MQTFSFKNPKFIKSCTEVKQYPFFPSGKLEKPEIAVCGRSNVGKSSLMNHLFLSKKLVKTSSVPGKTQTINFFTLDEQLVVVDLPGYGFAKVPGVLKRKWGPMIESYFQSRKSLYLTLFLLDLKRDPSQEDKKFLDWVISQDKSLIAVFTKVDQVPKTKRAKRVKELMSKIGVPNLQYLLYSVKENIGRNQLCSMITEAINEEINELEVE
ncbi:MAG: YihA family ribosome biogenesis GTP-binding protein [Chlamydiales bacterium]|nr:ribosome biogenesis GTP-binding protein YihA/YsxC [Chlamydiales bacterium]NCF71381.1 YihA family ribosome biogenesis GTP-binding protein [Chlamydiales bacterium]